MPRFIIHISEKKKRRGLLGMLFFIAGGVFILVISSLLDDGRSFLRMANVVISLNVIWLGIDMYRKTKRVDYIDIDENRLEWPVHEKGRTRISIDWSDVRWIKKEKDNSITVFQDSSFSKNVALKDFSEDDQQEIIHLFAQYATEKQLRVINFEESALAFV